MVKGQASKDFSCATDVHVRYSNSQLTLTTLLNCYYGYKSTLGAIISFLVNEKCHCMFAQVPNFTQRAAELQSRFLLVNITLMPLAEATVVTPIACYRIHVWPKIEDHNEDYSNLWGGSIVGIFARPEIRKRSDTYFPVVLAETENPDQNEYGGQESKSMQLSKAATNDNSDRCSVQYFISILGSN